MRIGELARHAGLTVRTLHHYDAIGLLKPSARSGGGYRLYGQADIARLHAIQAMRQLGLALEDVGRLLDGGGAPLPVIVEQQLRALDRQIAQAEKLRTRLELLQAKLSDGHVPESRDWLATIRMMTACDKYFSTDELKTIFGNWQRIAPELQALMAQVRQAMKAGIPADSLEVQPLAHRWMMLMGLWMDGNFDLIRRWGDMYKREPSVHSEQGPDLRMVEYVDRAIELRLAALGRHLSIDEMMRMKRVPPEEWEALYRAVGGADAKARAARRPPGASARAGVAGPDGPHGGP
ncbi:MerR family transcriptional regulator [Pyxidicoccus xibeiensis]|uniref:MerR family transcriptional regulator n=1 Tax=Pyxidicoccus xibeiensis TaxID=2906759 RepID=UPI0020A7CFBE|nr:MerR family transcriptional regulator [Pyxidicoccus xibeiensis]MCP3137771.1 MerR family transcriptional regulator [Pyxidicoccus xibeiensis]